MDEAKKIRVQWLVKVNAVLFISFVIEAITCFILYFVVMSKPVEHIVYEIHVYVGFLFIALAVLHIGLHWRVIKYVYLE